MNVRLFVKSGCPWCDEAMEWLDDHGIEYTTLNVSADQEAREEMRELTGQTKAPSIDVDGEILADFGADELEEWWEEKGYPVNPES
ncbi:glutaredoxin [Roseimicrobium gellanilyticum]|uniref:Glutaredoxin n=1 Tax=Roseimicrobium gellanilyticum TaxID=748857 RepID=A0A366HTD4_9BACT|nr:glutaredoxin family protein [Roseimicrobium gellanilyticum]RBP47546.1 glutaredoxin [Roseimicrobium gellanilyticum]